MKKLALALSLLLVSLPAHAARWTVGNSSCSAANCKLLNAVASNAAAASRTFTIDTAGWAKTVLQVNYVYNAGTAVTMTCTASLDGGTTYASITSTSISAGAGTVTAYVDTFAISAASANFLLEYDTRVYDHLKCVAAVTGGGASDTITVYANATRYETHNNQ